MDNVAQAERRAEMLRKNAIRSLIDLDDDITCDPGRAGVSAWVDLMEAPRDLIDNIICNLEHDLIHYDLDDEDQAIYEAVLDVRAYMKALRRVELEKRDAERERIGRIIARKKQKKKKRAEMQKAKGHDGK